MIQYMDKLDVKEVAMEVIMLLQVLLIAKNVKKDIII